MANAGLINTSKLLATSSIRFRTSKVNGWRIFSSQSIDYAVASDMNLKEILPGSKIPTLRSLPFFGNFFSILRHKDHDSIRMQKFYAAMARDYGPIFKLSIPGQTTNVYIIQPEDIQEMLAQTAINPVRSAFHSIRAIRYNAEGNYFQKKSGILSENHEEWQRLRKLLQQPIMQMSTVAGYLTTMDNVALDFVDRIIELRNEQDEVPNNFITELYKWALESISTVALNKRIGCLREEFYHDSKQMKMIRSVNEFFHNMQKVDAFPLYKLYATKNYKRMKICHDYLFKIADEHVRLAEKAVLNKSLKDTNLTLMETYLLTEGLSRTDVATFMTDLFIASIDTTSHTVAFIIYCLSKNPQSQKKLQAELDNVLGNGKESISVKQLENMSYLKLCIKETLRIFPVSFGIARQFQNDTVINKYLIPKGWQGVSINGVINASEKQYSQPKKFIPERWQRDRPHGQINPFSSLHFSHGTRSCIGRRVAEQEMYTLIARIFHRFNVEYNYEDLNPLMYVVLAPDKPLKFKFTERK